VSFSLFPPVFLGVGLIPSILVAGIVMAVKRLHQLGARASN